MKKCWKLRLSRLILLPILSLFTLPAFAQYDKVEEGYFQFPVQPERTNYLAGNMGELRASHFHAGIDIKTNGVEGLEVHAAADGYVSRIRVATGGYGNCVYVAHPNGTTTVYGHLSRFNKELAEYVLEKQYKQKSFTVNLFPERGEFKLKKGEILGLSGNSGSSTGPHLHFEIRDAQQEVLDPLRFGFGQIKDKIPPIAQRIAFKTMDIDSRVNGEFGRFEFNLERRGNEYVIADTILASGKIGIELWAHDKLDGAANRNGIPEIDVYQNHDLLFSQRIDTVDFALQDNIKVHTNYRAERETRRRYNKLYIDDGNDLHFYPEVKENGFFYPKKDSVYLFQIILSDAYLNQTRISFNVKGTGNPMNLPKVRSQFHSYLLDNTLQLTSKRNSELNNITLYTKEGSTVLEPAYHDNEENTYLIDLKKGLPKNIDFGDRSEESSIVDIVPSGKEHAYLSDSFSATFNRGSLFDTLYLKAKHFIDPKNGTEVFEIGEEPVPLKGTVEINLVPLKERMPKESYQVYNIDNPNNPYFVGGTWKEDHIEFGVAAMGRYTLLADSIAPTIQQRPATDGKVYFVIADALSGLKSFEATINGQWLLMNYEPKKSLIWSERLDKTKPLKGDFTLTVTDNAGNTNTINLTL